MTTLEIMRGAKRAAPALAMADTDTKNRALLAMAQRLEDGEHSILAANAEDAAAVQGSVGEVMLDRLMLSHARIRQMAEGIRLVAALPDPVGRVLSTTVRPNGLVIEKRSVPLGVIAIIYESRPNVTSDAAALALKAGSACILRGGKEAYRSARAITAALQAGLFLNASVP